MYMFKVQIGNWTSFEKFVVFVFLICVFWIELWVHWKINIQSGSNEGFGYF
jgi:hypothetical protein